MYVIIISVILATIITTVTVKILRKTDSSDDYEIDFEERHKNDFVNRFETDLWSFKNHID